MPRTPLRLLLLVAGAFGATLLWQGVAGAVSTPSLPVEAPVAPIAVDVPDLPLVAELTDSVPTDGIDVPTLPVPTRVEVPALDAVQYIPSISTSADAPTPMIGRTDAGSGAPATVTTAGPTAARPSANPEITTNHTVAAPTPASIETGDVPTPDLPTTPWTVSFAGVAAALTCVGADAKGSKRSDRSPLAGVVAAVRDTIAHWLGRLGPARPDPSRAGFALLLARPG